MTTNPFRPAPKASAPPVASGPASVPTGTEDLAVVDTAELVARAREIKYEKALLEDKYAAIRAELWERVDHAAGEIPDGDGAKFRTASTSPRRRVDYTALERRYPSVYAETVTVTEPDPDAVGALYL